MPNDPDESELSVLKDVRSLLHDLTLVFITLSPNNRRKLDLHKSLELLEEKLENFPKDEMGRIKSDTTVEFENQRRSHAELVQLSDDYTRRLNLLLEEGE